MKDPLRAEKITPAFAWAMAIGSIRLSLFLEHQRQQAATISNQQLQHHVTIKTQDQEEATSMTDHSFLLEAAITRPKTIGSSAFILLVGRASIGRRSKENNSDDNKLLVAPQQQG
jgi:hypothetical protein